MEWNARKQGNALSNDWNGTQVTNGAPYVINRNKILSPGGKQLPPGGRTNEENIIFV